VPRSVDARQGEVPLACEPDDRLRALNPVAVPSRQKSERVACAFAVLEAAGPVQVMTAGLEPDAAALATALASINYRSDNK
jgi:hypothetical protein